MLSSISKKKKTFTCRLQLRKKEEESLNNTKARLNCNLFTWVQPAQYIHNEISINFTLLTASADKPTFISIPVIPVQTAALSRVRADNLTSKGGNLTVRAYNQK